MSIVSKYINSNYGRGVFASRRFKAGEIVATADILVLSKEDTKLIQLTSLKHYTYSYNEQQDCLALGLGSLMNHGGEKSNLFYRLIVLSYDGELVTMLEFQALKDIEEGEELLIDYASDCPSVALNESLKAQPLIK